MFKKIIALGVLLIMAFSFAACGNGLQKQIDDLKSIIEQQNDKISELEADNTQQADKITELEEEKNRLMEEIEKLEDLLTENGIGIKSGYTSSGDPGTGYRCAFKSTKTEFNIDNVELTFSYGLVTPSPLLHPDGKVILYFSNSNDDRYTIKEIDLTEFISGKYAIKTVSDRIIFSHSEQIVIPKDLFIQEQGIIYFSIITDSTDEHFSMCSGGIVKCCGIG